MARSLFSLAVMGALALVACGSDDAATTASAQKKCTLGSKNCFEDSAGGTEEGPAPATATDGLQNGTETGVDCGGADANVPRCDTDGGCAAASDCSSSVCTGGKCQAPSATDQVKNGDETDIDCGGEKAETPRCNAGQMCKAHTDCATDACAYDGKCAPARSCAGHFGGDTCGVGEVDDPGKQHESCCETAPISDAAGAVQLDKYVITAGRMRQFIERTQGNLQGYIQSVGDNADWQPAWTAMLPTDIGGVNYLLGPGDADHPRAGCDLEGSRGRTYWMTDAENDQIDTGHHGLGKDILDQKALNCVEFVMLQAMCIWDGGRLATQDEIKTAWQGGENRKYPWGGTTFDATKIVWGSNYMYPDAGSDPSNWYYIAAPGRRPEGNGKFGHADLAGLVFELTSTFSGQNVVWSGSGSWEGHGVSENGDKGLDGALTRGYWATGGRCAHPVK